MAEQLLSRPRALGPNRLPSRWSGSAGVHLFSRQSSVIYITGALFPASANLGQLTKYQR